MFTSELTEEVYSNLKEQQRTQGDTRFQKEDKKSDTTFEDDYFGLDLDMENQKSYWEQAVAFYESFDPNTRYMVNLFLIGIAVFVFSKVMKYVLGILLKSKRKVIVKKVKN